MSYWDGNRWSDAETNTKSTRSRRANWAATAVMVIGAAALLVPFAASSAASRRPSHPPCTIGASSVAVGETYLLGVSGLPTGLAINLWVTDSTGTTVTPIGSTSDGTFNFQESSKVAGITSYAFTGPTKQKTTTYSTCSVTAS